MLHRFDDCRETVGSNQANVPKTGQSRGIEKAVQRRKKVLSLEDNEINGWFVGCPMKENVEHENVGKNGNDVTDAHRGQDTVEWT